MIVVFFVVVVGLWLCGVLDWIGNVLFGFVKMELLGIVWFLFLMVGSLVFLLNMVLVVMMVFVVVDWCCWICVLLLKLMILFSYFVMLGGVCLLIGMSMMLIIDGEM